MIGSDGQDNMRVEPGSPRARLFPKQGRPLKVAHLHTHQSCVPGGPGSCRVLPWSTGMQQRNRKILSPFGQHPMASQASRALGLARRKISIGDLAPKMVPMGSVSDTYSPMPVPESTEETLKKCRDDAKSSALLEKRPCSSSSVRLLTNS